MTKVIYDLSKVNKHIYSSEETKQCIEEETVDFFTQLSNRFLNLDKSLILCYNMFIKGDVL